MYRRRTLWITIGFLALALVSDVGERFVLSSGAPDPGWTFYTPYSESAAGGNAAWNAAIALSWVSFVAWIGGGVALAVHLVTLNRAVDRGQRGACGRCGYDLRGFSSKSQSCPECGHGVRDERTAGRGED